MSNTYNIPELPLKFDLEDKAILKQAAKAQSRLTAAKYLERIVELELLEKVRVGRTNYYVNKKLVDLLVNHLEIDR